MQFIVTEIGDRAVMCYPQGDTRYFGNREAATRWAEAISLRNNGVFQVVEIGQLDRRFQWWRGIVGDDLKIQCIRGRF